MFKVLQRLGYGCSEWTGQRITYHVEVKATVFGCDEAFSLSQNQMSMVRSKLVVLSTYAPMADSFRH